MNYRNRKLTNLANGAPCMLCGIEDKTIVAAHSNLLEHGKGKGIKSSDCFIAFLCNACHFDLDNDNRFNKTERRSLFFQAMGKTYLYLWQNELIKVA